MTSSHESVVSPPAPRYALPLLAMALPFLSPAVALAAGFEYGQPGARAEGRAGAEVAGTDSPTALYFNPANLAQIDRVRLLVGASALFLNRNCFQREIAELGPGGSGTYDPEAEGNAAVADPSGRFFVPEVCNDSRPAFVPQLLVSVPIIDGLTFAGGLIVPVGPQVGHFAHENGFLDDGTTPAGQRYLLTKQDIIQVFPTVGLGYAPAEWLRFGAAFGIGITRAEFSNFAFSDTLLTLNPGNPDVRNTLHAIDWFSPRITGSVAATPLPGLDVAFAFTWTGDVNADGNLDIDLPPGGFLDTIQTPPIDGVTLDSPQNWNIALGLRYASKLDSPVGTVGDRLATERWDVELNFLVFGNERVDDFVVDLPDEAMLGPLPLPDSLSLPHRWKNQYVVRLGGDFNAIPGVFAVRGGVSFESDGVEDGFEQLDFQPFRRVGLHVGATVRINDRVDLSVAYAHLFQQDIDNVGADCLNTPDLVNQPVCLQRPTSAEAPTADDLAISNAGRIESAYNVLSLEATYTFGGPRQQAAEPETDEWSDPEPAYSVPATEPEPYQGGGDVPADDGSVPPVDDSEALPPPAF